nr:hypothetical protein [Tanacetum cinerariifolium]
MNLCLSCVLKSLLEHDHYLNFAEEISNTLEEEESVHEKENQFIRETEDTITQTLASQGRTKGYMEQNVCSYVYDDC